MLRGALAAWAAAAALTALLRGQPPTQPAQPATQPAAGEMDARARVLAREVLADPLNVAAREELRRIRQEQDRHLRLAYTALADGLKTYLDAGAVLAAGPLEQAARSPRAVSLAASLPRPLPALLAEAQAAGDAERAARKKLCARCGGTGQADCGAHRCYASGKVPCPRCNGAGAIRKMLPGLQGYVYILCSDCGGLGVVPCQECGGTGTVPCPLCAKQPDGAGGQPPVPYEEARAIRQVICKARKLSRGGIDLYTDGALRCSPK
jgi:hypothetical protein